MNRRSRNSKSRKKKSLGKRTRVRGGNRNREQINSHLIALKLFIDDRMKQNYRLRNEEIKDGLKIVKDDVQQMMDLSIADDNEYYRSVVAHIVDARESMKNNIDDTGTVRDTLSDIRMRLKAIIDLVDEFD